MIKALTLRWTVSHVMACKLGFVSSTRSLLMVVSADVFFFSLDPNGGSAPGIDKDVWLDMDDKISTIHHVTLLDGFY